MYNLEPDFYITNHILKVLNKVKFHYRAFNLINERDSGDLTDIENDKCYDILYNALDFTLVFKTKNCDLDPVFKDDNAIVLVNAIVKRAMNDKNRDIDLLVTSRFIANDMKCEEFLSGYDYVMDELSIDDPDTFNFDLYEQLPAVFLDSYNEVYQKIYELLTYERTFNHNKKSQIKPSVFYKKRGDLLVLFRLFNIFFEKDITICEDYSPYPKTTVKTK